MNLRILILSSCFFCSSYANFEANSYRSFERSRLDEFIKPLQYDIRITPFLDQFQFNGVVSFVFKTDIPDIQSFHIHSSGLNIHSGTIHESVDDVEDLEISNAEDELLLIRVVNKTLIVDNEYTITINYSGDISDETFGFYRSSYVENNETKWLATTQFQTHYARRAFPCFDEPSYKANFTIRIDCPLGFICMSNMNATSEDSSLLPEGRLITFETTPKMSTYLVAFIVSEFEVSITTDSDDPEPFAIWSRPDAKDMGQYAFDIGRLLTKQMGQYVNISYYEMYPNMKMDQVAIPDFWAAAMENWGLVTYREVYLMYHPNQSSVRYRQRVATVMAHEIIHKWFGNYVTCHWWSDAWLNEAVARQLEYFLTNEVEDFGLEDQFIVTQIHTAFSADVYGSSPLSNPNVNSPSEIVRHFGGLTYNKGAAIVRMIQHLIGNSTYERGLENFLNTNAFSTAVPDDFYDALQIEADLDQSLAGLQTTIKDVMKPWIEESGYPLLTVEVNSDEGQLIILQRRFANNRMNFETLYEIPVTYTTEELSNFENTKPEFIMSQQLHVTNFTSNNTWIIFNIQQTGYYRVNYDDNNWNLLIEALNGPSRETIHRFNRAQIVDDAFNLALEDHIGYDKMFDIIQFLEFETDYAPWAAALSGFSLLRIRFMHFKDLTGYLENHIFQLMKVLVDDIGLDSEDIETNLRAFFRPTVLRLACELGDEACINHANEEFFNLKVHQTPIPANIREYVYCSALRNGISVDFQYLWNLYVKENVASEKVVILEALGCTRDISSLQNLLLNTINNDSLIRMHDKMTAFNSVLTGDSNNVFVVFDFVQNNIDAIKRVYGSDNLIRMFSSLAERMSESLLGEFGTFLRTSQSLTEREIIAGLSAITIAYENKAWTKSVEEEVLDWLVHKYSSACIPKLSSLLFILPLLILLVRRHN